MEFESQICTTRSQSERLLTLGLKKETADMHHYQYTEGGRWNIEAHPSIAGYTNRLIPAWSLHRLYEIACSSFVSLTLGLDVKDFYEDIIAHIQSLIHLGYLNEEYLNMDIVNKRENENMELLLNKQK